MANLNVVTWSGRSIYNNRLKGNGTEANNLGWGIGSPGGATSASAFSDVNLFGSVALASTPESRVQGTSSLLSSTQLADTYQVTGTITALASRAIVEVGLFDVAGAVATLSAQATIATLTTAATSVVIGANTRAFPSALNYYAQIDNEVVLVTGGQGTATLTFTRAQFGTANTTHAAGAYITAGGDGGAYIANNSTSSETWNPTGANGGSMFVHADFGVINLNTNDSIAFTLKVQLS